MFSQASKGLQSRPLAYGVRLLYHKMVQRKRKMLTLSSEKEKEATESVINALSHPVCCSKGE